MRPPVLAVSLGVRVREVSCEVRVFAVVSHVPPCPPATLVSAFDGAAPVSAGRAVVLEHASEPISAATASQRAVPLPVMQPPRSRAASSRRIWPVRAKHDCALHGQRYP